MAVICCTKENEPADGVPVSKCNGRYDKDIFSTVKTTSNVEYGKALNISGTLETLFLDIHEPQNDTAKKRHLIIYVHGGGFTGGSKAGDKSSDICDYFAKKGYVAASIDYRLGIENPLTEKTRYEVIYRAVQDVKAAVRYARANAASLKIDESQIFIGGYSAGAITVVHAAYWDESEIPQIIDKQKWGSLEGNSGNANFSSDVHAVFSIAGSIENLNWIEQGEPPIVAVHSKIDNTVPYNNGTDGLNGVVFGGQAIVQKAMSLNISASLYSFEQVRHGDYFLPENFPATTTAISGFLFTNVKCQ